MLQTLGSSLMVVFLLAYLGMCYKFYQKRHADQRKDLDERLRLKQNSLWKPDLPSCQ